MFSIAVERKACDPNPCNHNGVCTDVGGNTFNCDCDGTGYTGLVCNVLLINTPEIPALAVNSPVDVSFSSQPDMDFTLMIKVDDRNSIKVEPSSVTFSQQLTSQNISITASKTGLYKIEYEVSDNSLNYQRIPPVTVLVSDDDSGRSLYFDKLERGLLQSGCCEASESQLRLEFRCPSDNNNTLALKSTCGWVTKQLPHTVGVIFSEYDNFDMPVAIAGAKFESTATTINLQSLNKFEFQSGCIACSTGSVGHVFGPSCQAERISINDIQQFLKYESLAHTYLSQSMSLVPEWFRLKALLSNRSHDVHSYMVDLVYANDIERFQDCSELSALKDGLYSVMFYTGSLEVKLNEEKIQLISDDYTSMCFAVDLCAGATSPLYLTIPNSAHSMIETFDFMQDLKDKGWDSTISYVIISNSSILDEVPQHTYWNGNQLFSSNALTPYMVTKVSFNKSLANNNDIDNNLKADWSFRGNITWLYEDFDNVRKSGLIVNDILYFGLLSIEIFLAQYTSWK